MTVNAHTFDALEQVPTGNCEPDLWRRHHVACWEDGRVVDLNEISDPDDLAVLRDCCARNGLSTIHRVTKANA